MTKRINDLPIQAMLDSFPAAMLDHTNAESSAQVQAEISNVLRDAMDRLDVTDVRTALQYALWQHSWNQYGPKGSLQLIPNSAAARKNYSHGRLMLIDFSVDNIGAEFAYPHPAIVMASYSNLLIVIPMTTDRGKRHHDTLEAGYIRVKTGDARLQKPEGNPAVLMNDSIIMVPQMRVVSKNRIKKDLFVSLAYTPLLLEIEEMIVGQLCPWAAVNNCKEIEYLQDQIQQLQSEVSRKEAEILYRDELLKQYTEQSIMSMSQTKNPHNP